MNAMSALKVMLLLSALSVSLGCSSNRPESPQMVQFCLRDGDVDRLIDLLRQVASENGLNFVNLSSASQRDLSRLKMDPGYRVIDISASRRDGLGLAAGNLGLGAHEIAVGFTKGANAQESAKFIQNVMNMLESRWDVRSVVEGQGAMKSPECGAE